MPNTISIVSPVYQNEGSLDILVGEIITSVSHDFSDYEIILVDDGSTDRSWDVMKSIAKDNPKVKAIKLSRNFGQHVSTAVGINRSKSDWVCTVDADMQDHPSNILKFYQEAKKGYDIVYGVTKNKKTSLMRIFLSKGYFWTVRHLIGGNILPGITSFAFFSKKVANEHRKFSDLNKNHIFVLVWLGFKSSFIEFERNERLDGKSSYTMIGLIRYALAGIYFFPTHFISHFVKLGFVIAGLSFLYSIFLIFKYYYLNIQPGWTSLAVLISFFGGLILASIGIVGLYVGKIFEQVKSRPLFVIDEEINPNIAS